MSKIEALKLAISRTKHGVMRINDVVRDVNAAWVEAGEPYPLPMGEYKRRAWLLADLELMLAQLVDEAHAEALDMDEDFNCEHYSLENAQEQWKEIAPEVRGEILIEKHAEALKMNAETDRRRHLSVMASIQNTLMERDDLPELVEACHAEALEEDKRYTWLANRWSLFWAGCDFFIRRTMIEEAHAEALRIDAEQYADPVTCSIFQRNDGVQLALDSSCDVRFIRTSKNGEWFKAGFRNTDMEGYQPVQSDVLFTSMPSRTLSYSDGVMVVSEA
ncbi:hypothetical protein L8P14_05535 [Enterobacter kobei]|uniref:hypothetical protein n=1 Tax=Enterobacter kobei TaxID=208224 RepID=UPI001A146DA7|nr:hypothetical protein [Enterobacter kobei]EKY1591263.1 hypothetical protein [Enterobacter kobei]MCK7182655.1 hypothetical protein [Enterobacter kobei]